MYMCDWLCDDNPRLEKRVLASQEISRTMNRPCGCMLADDATNEELLPISRLAAFSHE